MGHIVYIWVLVIVYSSFLVLLLLHSQLRKTTIHQVTTMLATSKHVLFPGHNYLLTTGTDNPSLAGARAIMKVLDHQYWWSAGGCDLEIGHF